ncbi:MAG: hypothetical protein COV74_05900 [Candidatus Omnitrophica bacterium CG11_big_fil_rev_8_21_14_0_20_45_26]|uniref:Uncharacterized protein n=1 Tax=Candidatus Abzuiibacterium crystallinum TaxID=1974748 RepID=A0A2H0LPC5_9BACT|nr:MAG: hypothetical protein COV74_05900 [Candidatus Omnitrophica bacterium CG11_big_fil_rev_8_21_14_0_20_45_26]PIW64102.1 MAG: hypothetical protein COW12_07635 [Candidatus Omnitrophica bacterium CG12_big_fil_rev_8_21_14_0_65_45_16]
MQTTSKSAALPWFLKRFSSRRWAVYAVLFLGAFGIYSTAIQASFHMDDIFGIVRNNTIKHLSDVTSIWHFSPLRFVSNYSLALNYHFFGLNPAAFRTTNVMIHAVNGCLLYHLMVLLADACAKPASLQTRPHPAAFLAALIFVVHPLQTQAVIYLVQRGVLLTAFFYLSALIFYVQYRLSDRIIYYTLSLFAIVAAMLSKQIAFTLPLALLLIEWVMTHRPDRRLAFKKAALVPILISILIIPAIQGLRLHSQIMTHVFQMTNQAGSMTRWEYFLTEWRVIMTYLRLVIIPVGQNFDYDFTLSTRITEPAVLASGFGLLVLLGLTVWGWQKNRLMAAGAVLFFICLIPECSIFPLEDVIVEYRMYLPLAGLSMVMAEGLTSLLNQYRYRFGIYLAIIFTLTGLSCHRSYVWEDPIRLLTDTVQKSPRKARPWNNLATFYMRQNHLEKAEHALKKSLELDPSYAPAYSNLGDIAYRKHDLKEAQAQLQKAMALDPELPEPYIFLGHVNFVLGNLEKAGSFYKQALEVDPHFVSPYSGLANIMIARRAYAQAGQLLRQALDMNPDYATAYYLLGNIHQYRSEAHEAKKSYQAALRIDPYLKQAENNLGILYFKTGDLQSARIHLEKAVEIDAEFDKAYFNLANVYHALGEIEKAEQAIAEARRLAHQNKNQALVEVIRASPAGDVTDVLPLTSGT